MKNRKLPLLLRTLIPFLLAGTSLAGEGMLIAAEPGGENPAVYPGLAPAITEFMAANNSTLADGFGHYPDWIEIHNPAGTPQDLTGWYLTDNPAKPTKWRFPSASIPAGGYRVVFASKSDGTDPSGALHASFGLSAGGEYLALVRPDGTIASDYAPTRQYADISCGRSPGQSRIRFFKNPTPGAANNAGYWDWVKDTKFSVDRGFYTAAFDVAITTATPGATIRYTTDGSRPTETRGTIYTAPVPIAKTTVLRAFGYLDGFESTDVDAQTYVFIDQVARQPADPASWPDPLQYTRTNWKGLKFYAETVEATNWGVNAGTNGAAFRAALTQGLTISLSTDTNVLFDLKTGLFGNPRPEVVLDHAVSVELFDAAGGKSMQLNAAARMMGYSSRFPNQTKPNLRLLFKSEFVDATSGETFTGPGKLNYPLFEGSKVESFNTIALRGMLRHGLIGRRGPGFHDAFTHETFRDMGHANIHYRFVNVYINGLYMGVFQAQERPDDSYMQKHFAAAREDYDILKDDGLSSGTEDAWKAFEALVPAGSTLSEAGYQTVKNEYLDLERYADYTLLEMFVANCDWPDNNFYLACRRGTPAFGPPAQKWIPFTWDADLAVHKHYVNLDLFGPVKTARSPLELIWNALCNNPQWQRFFGDRVHHHLFNGGSLSVGQMNARWLRVRDELGPLAMGELCKWSNGNLKWWNAEVLSYTTDFWPQRHANSLRLLRRHGLYPQTDAPVFGQHGGRVAAGYGVAISNPGDSGTIWYTTDGSDPRDSATASTYTGSPVIVPETTCVKACVDSGEEWSAMNSAVFQVEPTQKGDETK